MKPIQSSVAENLHHPSPLPMFRLIVLIAITFVALSVFPTVAQQDPGAQAQQVVTTHNVRLRPAPSTDKKALMVLGPGEELQLLEATPTNGFYHVQIQEGDEGWVSVRYVIVKPQSVGAWALLTASSKPADAISETWDKPTPNKATFTGPDGSCPWNGSDSDPDTYIRKNRSDIPAGNQIHDVQWSAIHDLQFPNDKPLRAKWSDEHFHELAKNQ